MLIMQCNVINFWTDRITASVFLTQVTELVRLMKLSFAHCRFLQNSNHLFDSLEMSLFLTSMYKFLQSAEVAEWVCSNQQEHLNKCFICRSKLMHFDVRIFIPMFICFVLKTDVYLTTHSTLYAFIISLDI